MKFKNIHAHSTVYPSTHYGTYQDHTRTILIAMVAFAAIINLYYGVSAVTQQLSFVTDLVQLL